ncbi:Aste57867_2040 [Aphanomyces stellatus]|uniref:Aste57867_2040 protein n=1 Tax=Aphanomyces stellatus TaxID=120398 RepID=A0A485K6R1_9STRA|nr:hypothetical protein As57867_002036 [Aphanomyces stellatus]VFT79244.1 Aste57867_2040 [Aphanomyces stellatus]
MLADFVVLCVMNPRLSMGRLHTSQLLCSHFDCHFQWRGGFLHPGRPSATTLSNSPHADHGAVTAADPDRRHLVGNREQDGAILSRRAIFVMLVVASLAALHMLLARVAFQDLNMLELSRAATTTSAGPSSSSSPSRPAHSSTPRRKSSSSPTPSLARTTPLVCQILLATNKDTWLVSVVKNVAMVSTYTTIHATANGILDLAAPRRCVVTALHAVVSVGLVTLTTKEACVKTLVNI